MTEAERKQTYSEKKNQKDLMRINLLLKEIKEIMNQNESSYLMARELIRNVRFDIKNPKKVLKNVRKAYISTVEEAKAASIYNEVYDLLEKKKDMIKRKDIKKLLNIYEENIKSGEYKKARKFVKKISKIVNMESFSNHVSICPIDGRIDEKGRANIQVRNLTERTLTITNTTVSSDGNDVYVDSIPGFAILPRSQEVLSLVFRIMSDSPTVNICVEYDVGMEKYSQKACISFERKI